MCGAFPLWLVTSQGRIYKFVSSFAFSLSNITKINYVHYGILMTDDSLKKCGILSN